ncbi:hypothetical protein [Streptomyces cacaoi]|uniref:hypothetical protein n=1 Tax=Streptomyces cacaoi TaxID=1898 RepID=UPI003749CCC2
MAHAENSDFYQWLIHHARTAGWNLDETDNASGDAVPLRNYLKIWAAIALTTGLTEAQTAHLAHGLGVTPSEVTAAYTPEMRTSTLAEIRSHPDAHLDKDLNNIADA